MSQSNDLPRSCYRGLITLAAAVCLSCFGSSLSADEPKSSANAVPATLRVLSYNIHHGEGGDGKLDLERIATIIKSSEADVVAVQEVDRGAKRSQQGDQPAELAKLTGLTHFVFGKTIDLQGGEYGNLVLSRFPISDSRVHRLPNAAGAEPRGVVEAEIAPPGGEKFRLFATHFDFGSKEASEDDRQGAIRLVNERAAAGSQPAVFAGDFNSTPGSRTIKTIGETWSQANKDEAATVPVDRPAKQIDFIFLRPADRFKVAEFRVLNEPVASDHLPILAVVELTPATPAK